MSLARSTKKKTTSIFITESEFVYGKERYLYHKTIYKNSKTKLILICNICTLEFDVFPSEHLHRHFECPECTNRLVYCTREIFILRAQKIHGKDKYNYDKVDFKTMREKVLIICNKCKTEFLQIASNHISHENGCSKCARKQNGLNNRLSDGEIIERSKLLHGDKKFNYTKLNQIVEDGRRKIVLICNDCKREFEQLLHNHLSGLGCGQCSNQIPLTQKDFIHRSKKIYGNNKFNYDKTIFIKCNIKLTLICNDCNTEFEQLPASHFVGKYGCKICAMKEVGIGRRATNNEFIKKCNLIHEDRYDYSKVEYETNKDKVCIICKKCNKEFNQMAGAHLQGHGCPICKSSKGEINIESILSKNNINYIYQYCFIDCKNTKELPFDFHLDIFYQDIYLKELLIEYDGKQHRKPVDHFGGEKQFEKTQINDQIKNQYCIDNNLFLLRIPDFVEFKQHEEIIMTIINNIDDVDFILDELNPYFEIVGITFIHPY